MVVAKRVHKPLYSIFQIFFLTPSYDPADLNFAVLGSEKDGEFIRLPSYSALEPQLGRPSKVVAQVCLFYHHVCVFATLLSSTAFLTNFFSFLDGYILSESPSI